MRLHNVKQELRYIEDYDRLVKGFGLDKDAQLLELQRFLGFEDMWPDFLRFLRENYGK